MNGPWICIVYDRADEPFARNLSDNLRSRGIEVEPISSPSLPRQVGNHQWYIFVRTPNAVKLHTLDALVTSALEGFDRGEIQGLLAVATAPSESEDLPPLWSTIRAYNVGNSEQDWQCTVEKIVKTLSYSRALSEESTPNMMQTAGNLMGGRTRSRRWIIPALVCALLIGSILTLAWNSQRLISATTTHGKLTPTPHASPTINLTATHTAEILQYQKLYTNSIQGTSVLTLPLTATDQTSLWDSSAQCVKGENSYTAKASAANTFTLQLCMANKPGFSKNFAYQAKLSINQDGYAGGLVFRSNGDTTKSHYRFAFKGGHYSLVLANGPRGDQDLIESDLTLHPGKLTTLTVIISKNVIYLYIDGNYVYQTPDTLGATFDRVGVYAASQAGTETDVTFTDVKAWILG